MKSRWTKKLGFFVALGLGGFLASCASQPAKVEIPKTADPQQQISNLENKIKEGYAEQYDILAEKNFATARSYLKEAKSDSADGEDQQEILDDVAFGLGAMQLAEDTADNRRAKMTPILEARAKALAANAKGHPKTSKTIGEVDDEAREMSADTDSPRSDSVSKLQSRYLTIELNAIKAKQIGQAEAIVQGSKNKDAEDYAPMALKEAEVALANAKNLIDANRNDESTYRQAVADANQKAVYLRDVLAATKEGQVDEKTASTLVVQNRRIGSLKSELNTMDAQAEGLERTISSQEQMINEQQSSINSTEGRVAQTREMLARQETLNNIQGQFDEDQAQVVRSGDALIIRLKAINFKSGDAQLPVNSMPILSKVRDVAQELGAQKVTVQGHTDSTGGKKLNEELSEKRAESVAKYLENNGLGDADVEAEGFGYSKPLATNKTKEGRLANRRVDVVLDFSDSDESKNVKSQVQ